MDRVLRARETGVVMAMGLLITCAVTGAVAADETTKAHTGVASTVPGLTFRSGDTYKSVYDDALGKAVTRVGTWVQDFALGKAIAWRFDQQAPSDKKSLEGQPEAGVLYDVRVDRGLEMERGLRSVGYLGMGTNPVDVLATAMVTRYIATAPLSPFPDLERSGYVWVTLGADGALRYASFVGTLGAALSDAATRVIAKLAIEGMNPPVSIDLTPTTPTTKEPRERGGRPALVPPPAPAPAVILPAPRSVERPHPGADGSRDRPRPEREAKAPDTPKERASEPKREPKAPAREPKRDIIRGPLGAAEKDGDIPSDGVATVGTTGTIYKVRESKPAPTPELRWMVMDAGGRIIGYFSQRRDAQLVADTLAAAAKAPPAGTK